MNEPNELDIAQLKFKMRQMYHDIGFEASLQALMELMISARVLSEVINEERMKNAN